jgi:hypothetical protein
MEPEGMTRAWPMVPLMSKKTRPTQNQARISLRNFAANDDLDSCDLDSRGDLDSGEFFFWFVFNCHRHGYCILAHGLPRDLELMRDSELMECRA